MDLLLPAAALLLALAGVAAGAFALLRLGGLEGRVSELETRPSSPPPAQQRDGGPDAARVLSALDDRVRKLELERSARPSPEPAKISPRPPAVITPSVERREDRELQPAPPAPTAAASPAHADRQWLNGLLAAYAEMVEEGGSAVDAFIARYGPVAATGEPGAAGFVIGDDVETAMFWAVSAAPDLHALLPGLRAVNNWSAHFAPFRASAAAEHFGAAFEMQPDTPRFALREPAWARSESGGRRLTLLRKGRLEGFIN